MVPKGGDVPSVPPLLTPSVPASVPGSSAGAQRLGARLALQESSSLERDQGLEHGRKNRRCSAFQEANRLKLRLFLGVEQMEHLNFTCSMNEEQRGGYTYRESCALLFQAFRRRMHPFWA
jgi:hypothetical protein